MNETEERSIESTIDSSIEQTTDIPVIILAGGAGTRLKSVVKDVPKPLADVDGEPFLKYLVMNLYRQGVRHFVLSLHHGADQFESFIGQNEWPSDLKFETVTEPKPLGTGGALRYAVEALNLSGPFYVCNGDTILPKAFATMLETSLEQKDCSMAIVSVEDASRYGRVEFDGEHRVTGFVEKQEGIGRALINAGIYRLESEDLRSFADEVFSTERDLFPQLVAEGRLRAAPVESEFIDIGIPEDYYKFCEIVKTKRWPDVVL